MQKSRVKRNQCLPSRGICNTAVRIVALVLTLTSQLVMAQDKSSAENFTPAERLLFMTDHLAKLKLPAQLEYRYEKRGSLEEPAIDKATLDITREGNSKVSKVVFLSGARKFELPAIPDVEGNPIILHFFEREIREMSRLTKGSLNYYRKRIRMALANKPKTTAITVNLNGKMVKATQIRIDPYLDDPARSRYEKFATKYYELTLADEVPGGVLSLHTELHGINDASSGTGKPGLLLSETLTFVRQNK